MKMIQEMMYPSIDDIDGLAKCLEFGEDPIHALQVHPKRDSSCFLTPEDSPVGIMDSEVTKTCKNGEILKSNQKSLRLVPKLENGRILFELELNSDGSDVTGNDPDRSSASPLPPFADEEISTELLNSVAAAAVPVKIASKTKQQINVDVLQTDFPIGAGKIDLNMPAQPTCLEDGNLNTVFSSFDNKPIEHKASRVVKKGLYQEVVKVMKETRKEKNEDLKVSSKTSLELRSLDSNQQLSKALTKALGNRTVTHKIPGTDSIIVCPTGEETDGKESIGSSENPIQVLQQGNMYYSLHSLSDEQLKNLCSVLRDNYNRVKKVGCEEKQPINTRIVYQVMQQNNGCEEADAGEEHMLNGDSEKPIQRTRSGRLSKPPRNYEEYEGKPASDPNESESSIRPSEAKTNAPASNEDSVHHGETDVISTQKKVMKPGVKKRRVSWQRLSPEEREVRRMDKRRQSLKELCCLCSKEELLSAVLPSVTPLLSTWQFVLKKSEDVDSGVIEPQSVLSNINSIIVELKKVFQSLCRPDTNTESEDPLVNLSEHWETVATGMHYGKYLVSAEKWIKYTQQQLEETICKRLDGFQEEDGKSVEASVDQSVSEKRKYETIENEPNKKVKSGNVQPELTEIELRDVPTNSPETGKKDEASSNFANGGQALPSNPLGYVLLQVVNSEAEKPLVPSLPQSSCPVLATLPNPGGANVNSTVKRPINTAVNSNHTNIGSEMGSTVSILAMNQVVKPFQTCSSYQSTMNEQAPKPKAKKTAIMRNRKQKRIDSKNATMTSITVSNPIGNLIPVQSPIQNQIGTLISSQSQVDGLMSVQGCQRQTSSQFESTVSSVPHVQKPGLPLAHNSSNQNGAQVFTAGSTNQPVVCVQNGNLSLATRYVTQGVRRESMDASIVSQGDTTGSLNSVLEDLYIPVTCIQQPLVNVESGMGYILQNTFAKSDGKAKERLPPKELSTRNSGTIDNCVRKRDETAHQNAQLLSPVLISSGSPVHLSRGPATPLSLEPSTPLSIGPSTPLSIGPTTPLSIGANTPLSIGPATPLSIVPNTPLSVGPATPLSIGPNTPMSLGPATPLSVVPSSLEEKNVSKHYLIDVQSLVQAKQNEIVNTSKNLHANLDRTSAKNEKGVVRKRSKTKARASSKTKKDVSKIHPQASKMSASSVGSHMNESSSVILRELANIDMSKTANQSSSRCNLPGLTGTPSVTFTADTPISTIEILDTRSTANLNIEAQEVAMLLPNKQADPGLDKSAECTQDVAKLSQFVHLQDFLKADKTKGLRNMQPPSLPSPKSRFPITEHMCVDMRNESLRGLSSECLPPLETHKGIPKTLPTEMFSSAVMTNMLKVADNERAPTFSPPVIPKCLSAELLPLVDDSSLSSISDLLKLPPVDVGSEPRGNVDEPRTSIIQTNVSADQYPSCTTPSSFTAAIDSMATKGGDLLLTTMSENTPRLSTPLTASLQMEENSPTQDNLYLQKRKQNSGEVISKRHMASNLDDCIRLTKSVVGSQHLTPKVIQSSANENCSNQHDPAMGLVTGPCITRLKNDVLTELNICDNGEAAPLKNEENHRSRVAHTIFTGDFSSEDSSASLFKTLECNLNGVSDKIDNSNFSSLVNDDSLSALLGGQGPGAEMEVSNSEPSNPVPYWHDNAMIDIEDILTTTS